MRRSLEIEPIRSSGIIGITAQPSSFPETFDAEALWETVLIDSIEDLRDDESDSDVYDLIKMEVSYEDTCK